MRIAGKRQPEEDGRFNRPGGKSGDKAVSACSESSLSHLSEETVHEVTAIKQGAFFLLFADRYDPEWLRETLPGLAFQKAITAIEGIATLCFLPFLLFETLLRIDGSGGEFKAADSRRDRSTPLLRWRSK